MCQKPKKFFLKYDPRVKMYYKLREDRKLQIRAYEQEIHFPVRCENNCPDNLKKNFYQYFTFVLSFKMRPTQSL
jgi:hypothetical protein